MLSKTIFLLPIFLILISCDDQSGQEFFDVPSADGDTPVQPVTIGDSVQSELNLSDSLKSSLLYRVDFDLEHESSVFNNSLFDEYLFVNKKKVHMKCGHDEDPILWTGGVLSDGRRWGAHPDGEGLYCMRDSHSDNGRKAGFLYTGTGIGKTKKEVKKMRIMKAIPFSGIDNEGYSSFAFLNRMKLDLKKTKAFSDAASYSVSFWMKTSKTKGVLFSSVDTKLKKSGMYLKLIKIGNEKGHLELGCYDSKKQLAKTRTSRDIIPALNDQQWHHVVAICPSTGQKKAKLYIDSYFISESSQKLDGMSRNNYPLSIGAQYNLKDSYNGRLMHFRAFKKTVSQSEIDELYSEI